MKFKKWFNVQEMASFTVPSSISFEIPCNRKMGGGCWVAGIDMRFEDIPQIRDKSGNIMSQNSKFVAKLPSEPGYLVYHGLNGLDPNKYSEEEIALLSQDYEFLPDDWWKRAEPIGTDGSVLRQPNQEKQRQQHFSS